MVVKRKRIKKHHIIVGGKEFKYYYGILYIFKFQIINNYNFTIAEPRTKEIYGVRDNSNRR